VVCIPGNIDKLANCYSNHCIRGHRSTNCTHNDRLLFYIRKTGRSVSQCNLCRSLRKNRSLHTRCDCPTRVQNPVGGATEVADLPNGIRDSAAKHYVELLNTDQGRIPHQKSNSYSDGCRNCKSSGCQQPTPSIAPASPSPPTVLSTGGSPYSFSPSFTSVAPQLRA
jgi:Copper fist DNA binding domain